MSERMISDVPGSGLVCPRCGFEQPTTAECARCGVVFAKLRAEGRQPAGPPSASPRSQAAAPAETRSSGRLLGWLVMLLLVVAAVAVFPRNRPEPEPAAAVPQAAVQTASAPPPPSPMPAPSPEISPELALPEPPEPLPVAPSEPSPEPAAEANRTPVRMPLRWYAGALGYRQAMDEAKADGRVVAVYFYTDWCPYCRRLDRDLLQTTEVLGYFQSVVKVKINPESGPAEQELSDRYGVTGYPSFFIETPATGEAQKIQAFTRAGEGWRIRTPEEFVDLCRRAAAG